MRVLQLCFIGITSLTGSMVLIVSLFGTDVNQKMGLVSLYETHGGVKLFVIVGILLWLGYIYATQCLFLEDETFKRLDEELEDEIDWRI